MKNSSFVINGNWAIIHKDFAKESVFHKNGIVKTYQQQWRYFGFTFEEANKWIKAGWKPNDIKEVSKWREAGFTGKSAKEWIKAGYEECFASLPYDWNLCGFSLQETEKWKELFREALLASSWKKLGFDFRQTQKWIQMGADKNDYDLVYQLREDNYQPANLTLELKNEYSWKDIDPKFNFQERKKWENKGFNYQETKEWIDGGLEPVNSDDAKN